MATMTMMVGCLQHRYGDTASNFWYCAYRSTAYRSTLHSVEQLSERVSPYVRRKSTEGLPGDELIKSIT